MAIVSTKSAALFVDGRYTLQAPEQVNTGVFKILQIPQNKPTDWLKETLKCRLSGDFEFKQIP